MTSSCIWLSGVIILHDGLIQLYCKENLQIYYFSVSACIVYVDNSCVCDELCNFGTFSNEKACPGVEEQLFLVG